MSGWLHLCFQNVKLILKIWQSSTESRFPYLKISGTVSSVFISIISFTTNCYISVFVIYLFILFTILLYTYLYLKIMCSVTYSLNRVPKCDITKKIVKLWDLVPFS